MQTGNVPIIHNCCGTYPVANGNEPSFLDRLNEELAKQIYNGEDSLGTQGRLIAKEALHLVDGLKQGYGVTSGWNTPDTLAYQLMEFNIFEFCESKTEARLAAMTNLLIDKEKLQIRSFEDFKKLALKEVKEFNEEWLLTEYNLSISVGQNAAAYNRFMTEIDDFPFVQYQTAGDSRVRNQHQKLDGLIFNLSDKNAMKLFPPNGYGCRCEMIQVSHKPDHVTSGNEATELMMRSDGRWKGSQFAINRGDLKQVFTNEQFYADIKGMSNKINDMTFDKYDLKPYNKFKQDLKPIKLDETITEDNVKELFKVTGKTKGNKNFMGFEDYFKRKLILQEATFKQHTKGHYIKANEVRHQLFPYVKNILIDPDEVWIIADSKMKNQTLKYIKFYKDKAVVVLCEMNNTSLEIKTWFEMKNEKGTRTGLLIKQKKG